MAPAATANTGPALHGPRGDAQRSRSGSISTMVPAPGVVETVVVPAVPVDVVGEGLLGDDQPGEQVGDNPDADREDRDDDPDEADDVRVDLEVLVRSHRRPRRSSAFVRERFSSFIFHPMGDREYIGLEGVKPGTDPGRPHGNGPEFRTADLRRNEETMAGGGPPDSDVDVPGRYPVVCPVRQEGSGLPSPSVPLAGQAVRKAPERS